MKLKCLEFQQHGQKLYVGKIKLKDFFSLNYEIAEWKSSLINSEEQGYQRAVEPIRAKRFGKYINSRQISPPAIYLAIRDVDTKHAKISYGNGELMDLHIEDGCPVYIVDGQHRIRGLEDQDVKGKLADFELPFVLLYGKTKYEEAEQFVIINKTHKVVRTDLAERFVQEAIKKKGHLVIANDPNSQIFRNSAWIGTAIEIVDILNRRKDPPSVWHDKIRLPNESRGSMTTVSQKSFTDSLRVLLDPAIDAPMSHMTACEVVNVLDAFWNAIAEICPEPFKDSDASSYAIQGTIGAMSLHRVLMLLFISLGVRNIKKEEFMGLLDVKAISEPKHWDRTIPIPGSELKGGKWTRAGTNNKSFRIIADEILREIKKAETYRKMESRKVATEGVVA